MLLLLMSWCSWIFYFDGGHWCVDQYSCNVRYGSNPGLMSSKNQPKTLLHNYGITSPSAATNPYFSDANHVYLPYCTSDVFRGGEPPMALLHHSMS